MLGVGTRTQNFEGLAGAHEDKTRFCWSGWSAKVDTLRLSDNSLLDKEVCPNELYVLVVERDIDGEHVSAKNFAFTNRREIGSESIPFDMPDLSTILPVFDISFERFVKDGAVEWNHLCAENLPLDWL